MTVAYAVRQCNEYGKLGMLGMTVLYSSGGKQFQRTREIQELIFLQMTVLPEMAVNV